MLVLLVVGHRTCCTASILTMLFVQLSMCLDAGKGRDAKAPMQSLAEVSQLVAFREKEQLGRDGLFMSFSNTFSFKDLNFMFIVHHLT